VTINCTTKTVQKEHLDF